MYKDYIKRSIDGMNKLVRYRDGWAYFPGDILYLDETGRRIAYSPTPRGRTC